MSAIGSYLKRQFTGTDDPARASGWTAHAAPAPTGGSSNHHARERMGFFTDTSICIGCKACEVACKEWNRNPEDGIALTGQSYDNTGALGADTWRHVAFIEQTSERIVQARESGRQLVDLGMPTLRENLVGEPEPEPSDPEAVSVFDAARNPLAYSEIQDFRWLMSSDVCKHCTHAGCLDNCPTGALFRTEFGTVVVQADVCNGCGYCVSGCPFGVIERRRGRGPERCEARRSLRGALDGVERRRGRGPERSEARRSLRGATKNIGEGNTVKNHGNAQKCTLCYDRLVEGQTPACAQTCPTTSIKFGTHAEMFALAEERVAQLHAQGMTEARLYGANAADGVGGTGSIFLLLDEPEVYGLPPDPVAPSRHLGESYKRMLVAAGGIAAAGAVAFFGGGV